MKKVIVASINEVKVRAAENSLKRVFPQEEFEVSGVAAKSGVSEQPFSQEEAKKGAWQRITAAKELVPDADIYMAFEGAVEKIGNELWLFAWAAALDKSGNKGNAKSSAFPLPQKYYELVAEKGMEMGPATDLIFNDENSKRKGGAVSHLSDGAITREAFYINPGIFSLLPLMPKGLY